MFSLTKRSLQMDRGLKERRKNHIFSSSKMNIPLSLWCANGVLAISNKEH